MQNSIHIGDGAYITLTEDGAFTLTANHHDPMLATDTVVVEARDVSRLIEFLKEHHEKA